MTYSQLKKELNDFKNLTEEQVEAVVAELDEVEGKIIDYEVEHAYQLALQSIKRSLELIAILNQIKENK